MHWTNIVAGFGVVLGVVAAAVSFRPVFSAVGETLAG